MTMMLELTKSDSITYHVMPRLYAWQRSESAQLTTRDYVLLVAANLSFLPAVMKIYLFGTVLLSLCKAMFFRRYRSCVLTK